MAVLRNKDNTEFYIDCDCSCDTGIRFRINKDEFGEYCFMSYTNGNFYAEQSGTLRKKLKKIWAIIRNKDFYYSDIILNKEQFEEFKEYLNGIQKTN